jgi:hypothetical protein
MFSPHWKIHDATLKHLSGTTDHSGHAVYGMNCLCSLERWDYGFESQSRHGCMCAFILFVLSCV